MRQFYYSLVPVFRRVINLSLSSGLLPKELKVALVLPLLNKLNADFEQFSNLRPASNLKFLSKLIEKTVFVQLNNYLGENNLHEPLQSAYKTFHSTETLDKGENVFPVLLNLSAAFDTVNHALLSALLQKSFGISGTVLQWFNSYLPQRTQSVKTSMRRILRYLYRRSFRGRSPRFSSRPVLYLLYTAPLTFPGQKSARILLFKNIHTLHKQMMYSYISCRYQNFDR